MDFVKKGREEIIEGRGGRALLFFFSLLLVASSSGWIDRIIQGVILQGVLLDPVLIIPDRTIGIEVGSRIVDDHLTIGRLDGRGVQLGLVVIREMIPGQVDLKDLLTTIPITFRVRDRIEMHIIDRI